jgi:NAD(P)-dependent dehydrogenase (short-subunit alcohol dehydrogenase family)
MDLSGKVAVITGAASGIGEATVKVFLEARARVVAVDLNIELTRMFEGADPSILRCVIGDVADETTSANFVKTALEAFGRIDVMICNAGIALPKPIHETTPQEWDRVMNVNVKAIYHAARHVVPVMKKQGGGLFLLTGSISSVCGMEMQGVYGPSKGAVIQIARTMAVDYARDNIRVNAVCPGVVETPLLRRTAVESGDPEKFLGDLGAGSPIGRNAQPEEIARFFQFLASDHARFFTGSVLMIDGGFSAR